MNTQKTAKMLFHYRRWIRRFVLAFVIVNAMVFSFALRFEFAIPPEKLPLLMTGTLLALLVKLPIYCFLGLDRGGWRLLDFNDIRAQFTGNLLASGVFTAATLLAIGPAFPRSVYIIDFLLSFLITSGILVVIRLYNEPNYQLAPNADAKNILIYGAGEAGRILLREIQSKPSLGYRVVGFIDDDRNKVGLTIYGVRVLGTGRQIAAVAEKLRKRARDAEEVIVAMPSANSRAINEAVANARVAKLHAKTIPSLAELATGRSAIQIRDVSYPDLLGREPVRLDQERIRLNVRGQSVMVTGGGGSIGSELCRQLARFSPSKLVIFDQAESDVFRIEREINQLAPDIEVVAAMGSVRSVVRIHEVIETHNVESIFHAAAYKHVPMMEAHPLEAVDNNVLGTHKLIEAARAHRVSSFVMISSDKAVNPTNIMGLTKRLSELLVASMPVPHNGIGTRFVSVRFGNVLGSNGSVVPVFQQQIAEGGPVTVTHPQMRRYFMTIPEAVQLVLEASPLGRGGEIFVLDMGKPVSILELAKTMIQLSGRQPEDIEIRFTGLRPGEKLFEELQNEGENILPTHHSKIKIFGAPPPDREEMRLWVQELQQLIRERNPEAVVAHMASLVPEYTPSERWERCVRERTKTASAY